MSSNGTNITTATTTELKDTEGSLQSIVVNAAAANGTIAIHDNTTVGITADANGIAESQTPGGAGNLTLDGSLVTGGVATLGYEQIVEIVCAGDETARTFTVTGTDTGGKTITEEITGVNANTASGSKFFKTVTQIAVDAATAGAVEAGVPAVTSTLKGTVTFPSTLLANQFVLDYDMDLKHGLTVVTTGTSNITVIWS